MEMIRLIRPGDGQQPALDAAFDLSVDMALDRQQRPASDLERVEIDVVVG